MVRDFSLYFLQIRHRLGRGYEVEEGFVLLKQVDLLNLYEEELY